MTVPDLQPTLIGSTITLRPLAASDFEPLYAAASDPAIWEHHPDRLRHEHEVFRDNFFAGALSCGAALSVVDNNSGALIGSSRYYDWYAQQRALAIGYTFLTRQHWGTGVNREMKSLMLGHAFNIADTVWFHVGEANLRSRRAVEKLGAVLSHKREKPLNNGTFTQLFYRLDRHSTAPFSG